MLLGCPIIETSALKGEGLSEVIDEAVKVAKKGEYKLTETIFEDDIEKKILDVEEVLPDAISENEKRWYAIKLLERDSKSWRA